MRGLVCDTRRSPALPVYGPTMRLCKATRPRCMGPSVRRRPGNRNTVQQHGDDHRDHHLDSAPHQPSSNCNNHQATIKPLTVTLLLQSRNVGSVAFQVGPVWCSGRRRLRDRHTESILTRIRVPTLRAPPVSRVQQVPRRCNIHVGSPQAGFQFIKTGAIIYYSHLHQNCSSPAGHPPSSLFSPLTPHPDREVPRASRLGCSQLSPVASPLD